MARTMQQYVDTYESVPVLVLACYQRYRHVDSYTDGASVYPACQNLLLAARALGFGGVMTGWQFAADAALRSLLHIPDEVEIMATITLGRPQGRHGPVRRRPLPELVYGDRWGEAPDWAVDPRARPTRRPGRPLAANRVSGVAHARGRLTMHAVDSPVFDADNHYYEALDAFTRHLDPKLGPRVIEWVDITAGAITRSAGGSAGR